MNLDTFTTAYIEATLWSSTDNADDSGGEPLDKNYGVEDIAEESLAKMVADCRKFQDEQGHLFEESRAPKTPDDVHAGHDFWLTRNGHGAGFWDGDWREPAATRLTEASKSFGSCDLYVGDDGKVYAS
jgi:hypothetical protein